MGKHGKKPAFRWGKHGKKPVLNGENMEKSCFRWGKPIVTPMGKLIEKMIYIHGGL